jgi:hypothetical protein
MNVHFSLRPNTGLRDVTLAYAIIFFKCERLATRSVCECARVARSHAHALGVERRFTCCTHDRVAVYLLYAS